MKQLPITIAAVVLVGCGNSEANQALLDAAKFGNIKAAKAAIADGADVNAIVDDWTPLHPLSAATWKGHAEIAKLLIAEGSDVNTKDERRETPLHWAVEYGHTEIAELLIANGADVNAKDMHSKTPLHWAARNGSTQFIELLVAKGGNVNAKDSIEAKFFQATLPSKERNPLDIATLHKHQQLANLLRKYGGKTGEELKAEGK